MNARNAVALALRLTGVVLLCREIAQVTGFLGMALGSCLAHGMVPPSELAGFLPWLVGVVVAVAFPICIIWRAGRVARWLVPGGEDSIGLAVSEPRIVSVALCVLGLALVGAAIPALARAAVQYLLLERPAASLGISSRRLVVALAGRVAQALFGLFLFLQAEKAAQFWRTRQKPASSEGSE